MRKQRNFFTWDESEVIAELPVICGCRYGVKAPCTCRADVIREEPLTVAEIAQLRFPDRPTAGRSIRHVQQNLRSAVRVRYRGAAVVRIPPHNGRGPERYGLVF